MSLLDTLKAKRQNQQTPAAAAPKQEQVQEALQTKATGKAVAPGSGPKASNLGEAQAFQTAKVQQKQVSQQGAAQEGAAIEQAKQVKEGSEQQMTAVNQEAELKKLGISSRESQSLAKIKSNEDLTRAKTNADEQLRSMEISHKANMAFYDLAEKQQFDINDLAAGLKKSTKELESDEQMAVYEQRAHTSAMRSKEYVSRITKVGKLSRLNEDANFKVAAMEIMMGDRAALLQSKIDSDAANNADIRENTAQEAEARLRRSIELGVSLMQDEMKKMKFEAGSKAVQAVVMGGINYASSSGMLDSAPKGNPVNSYHTKVPISSEIGQSQDLSFSKSLLGNQSNVPKNNQSLDIFGEVIE